jgi:hypothetical protein
MSWGGSTPKGSFVSSTASCSDCVFYGLLDATLDGEVHLPANVAANVITKALRVPIKLKGSFAVYKTDDYFSAYPEVPPPSATPPVANVIIDGPGWATIWMQSGDSFAGGNLWNSTAFVYELSPNPELNVSLSPNTLVQQGAGQGLVSVAANLTVRDTVDSNPVVKLVGITCNEQLDSGDIQGAALGTDDRSFKLRASSDTASGRIYTVTYSATDNQGNTTVSSADIKVVH